jgi:NAD(P)-dependent dehydrogenase (short-subunit alcohol dehydrogenase family)
VPDTQPLAGQTAIITGGAGALGSASAYNLAKDGAAVLLMGRTLAKLEEGRRGLLAKVPDARVELFAGDAMKPEDVEAGMQKAYDIQGRLDIIVALVGGGGGGGGMVPILMQNLEQFRAVLDRNVLSAFLAVRYGVPFMKQGGAIVCFSSTVAKIPFPYMAAYTASKCAVEGFVKCAADELSGAGIRVNAVRPGLTKSNSNSGMFDDKEMIDAFAGETPLVPFRGGFGEPDDIGRCVRWLAGPESSWVTGQSIAVDGGHELRKYPDVSFTLARTHGLAAVDAVRKGRLPDVEKG